MSKDHKHEQYLKAINVETSIKETQYTYYITNPVISYIGIKIQVQCEIQNLDKCLYNIHPKCHILDLGLTPPS